MIYTFDIHIVFYIHKKISKYIGHVVKNNDPEIYDTFKIQKTKRMV